MEYIQSQIPQPFYNILLPISVMILLNIVSFSECTFLGCYNLDFSNFFRVNLLCNACTDLSYHLKEYQLQIYFSIGGILLKTSNDFINSQIKNIQSDPFKSSNVNGNEGTQEEKVQQVNEGTPNEIAMRGRQKARG